MRGIQSNLQDSLIWKVTSSGSYTVKACYLHPKGGVNHEAPVKILWNPCVPTKVGFFAWEVWWGKVLTMEQVKRRGHQLASKCSFCGNAKESLEHLLVHCPLIWDLWTALLALPRTQWVYPFSVKDILIDGLLSLSRKNPNSYG